MATYDYDIGIIGGGAAGLTVAAGAAQLGAKTLLIEKEPELGGDCLHYGCVPSKTLIKTARVYHLIKNAHKYGLPKQTALPVDFKAVHDRIHSVIDTIQRHDSVERFCKLGALVEFGAARFSDEHTVAVSGKSFTARKWVIATGSTAFIPPIKGTDSVPYLTNKNIFDLRELPSSLIIIGGGPIGIEMAQSFNRLGSNVTVIDMADQILSKEDTDMANDLVRNLESEGITFKLGVSVKEIKSSEAEKEVFFETKDKERQAVSAHSILIAVGRAPVVEEMGLKEIGIEYDRRGIHVDTHMKTTQKHIFAAGDCTGGYQFTHAAGYEGGIIISNAIFHLPRKADYTYMPWCTYSDPELASIGMNEKAAQGAGIEYDVWTERFSDNDRAVAEGETVSKIKMLLDKKENPIGIQILGPHAGELVSEWVAIFNGAVKLSTLAGAIHPYPTLGEINKRVAGSFFGKKIFSDKVKKGLKFFFHLKGRACEI